MSVGTKLLAKGTKRKLTGPLDRAVTWLCVALALYQLYSIIYAYPTVIVYRGIHLSVLVALSFLIYTAPGRPAEKRSAGDTICALLALAVGTYIVLNSDRLAFRHVFLDPVTGMDLAMGILMLCLVLEATRRVVGYPLTLLAALFLAYPFFGAYIPGLFGHRGFSFLRVLETTFLTTSGIFGMPVGVASTYVFMFTLFGEVLTASGAGDVFYDLSRSLAGAWRGGMAKTAVVASAFFGSISGSPIANVATTGSFTIPMMKKRGYPAYFAGAVETAASCGGTIMPPVMGAVAFVMAEILGVSYSQIMVISFIPALLYFGTVFLGVDSAAIKLGLQGIPRSELPKPGTALLQGLRYLGPLTWLICRILSGFTVNRAVFEATLLIILCSFFTRDQKQWMSAGKIAAALAGGVKGVLMIAVACSAAGIIVGIISLTGVGVKFTSVVLALASGRLFLALILTAIVTVILGMGMNITPTYILSASLAAPALIKAGIEPISAHMFILYFAAMATMTPPVAMAAYTAASIADTDPMRVGFAAVRLGIVAYIIPFIFIYRPELLLHGSPDQIALPVLAIFAGCYALANGVNRWLLCPATRAEQIGLLIAALALFWPDCRLNAIGLAVLFTVLFLQIRRQRTAAGHDERR
ncbi:MAG: TRAP transporter permease [bacterium]|jgi:TRAP transporter 4TM/12TM fusion protein